MDEQKLREQLHRAAETRLSELQGDPWLAQRVLAQAKGEPKVKKKISVGFVLVLVLMLAAVTALAVGLTNYFSGFADLENTYGTYEQWPKSAKVELVELMMDNGVLNQENTPQWTDRPAASDKEELAEVILSDYFSGMSYVDTYNAMTRELGPIEQWSDEERALYTSLLEKHGKLTNAWPAYMVPGDGDLTRQQAVSRARDAALAMFSVSEEELDSLVVDAIFSEDEYNIYGAPKDEPFWIVEFGYGLAYRIYMTRTGEMLGIMGPQTQFIAWGRDALDGSTKATPGEHDVDRGQAVMQARNALTEIMNVSYDDVDEMDATAYFVYSDLYAHGTEPVWVVIWSKQGDDIWKVLLGYDGSYMDIEPAGKIFDQVLRSHKTLADIWRERCGEIGITEHFFNANGVYCFDWSISEKAVFSETWIPIVEEYLHTNPYAVNTRDVLIQWTRNVFGTPDQTVITQAQALLIAERALKDKYGDSVTSNYSPFYIVTNPEKPEWRFVDAIYLISINAISGEVMLVTDESELGQELGRDNIVVDDFIAYIQK